MNRPPPCGRMGLVAPNDIASGIVTAASGLWVAQGASGVRPFSTWTAEQRANANVWGVPASEFSSPGNLNTAAMVIGQYLAGIRDTFPVCTLAPPVPPGPPAPGAGRGLLLVLLGGIAIWAMQKRSR